MTTNAELKVALKAARRGGDILRENFGRNYRTIRKSSHELVTEVDILSQTAVLDVLGQSPFDFGVYTEEQREPVQKKGKNWIIDPLDGTHNYIAGLPFSSVSIALAEEGELLLGVIYFPGDDHLFHAVKGGGAFLNDRSVHVSGNDRLDKAVVNFDNQFHLDNNSYAIYRKLTECAFTTRIFGTATMDLCLIASGKIDGRIFLRAKAPDIAAGCLILTEAGGCLTDFGGAECGLDSTQIVASNGKIHTALLEVVQ